MKKKKGSCVYFGHIYGDAYFMYSSYKFNDLWLVEELGLEPNVYLLYRELIEEFYR